MGCSREASTCFTCGDGAFGLAFSNAGEGDGVSSVAGFDRTTVLTPLTTLGSTPIVPSPGFDVRRFRLPGDVGSCASGPPFVDCRGVSALPIFVGSNSFGSTDGIAWPDAIPPSTGMIRGTELRARRVATEDLRVTFFSSSTTFVRAADAGLVAFVVEGVSEPSLWTDDDADNNADAEAALEPIPVRVGFSVAARLSCCEPSRVDGGPLAIGSPSGFRRAEAELPMRHYV